MTDTEIQRVQEALEGKRQELLSLDNVVSVGIGRKVTDGVTTDEVCAIVGVKQKLPESQIPEDQIVPSSVRGVTTDVQEVGEFVAQVVKEVEPQADRRGENRPVPQGVSVGHPDVTAGTTGWMYSTDDGNTYVGSNNHVLANVNAASVGDNTLQPGTADGGVDPDSKVGTLSYFKEIADGVTVDLAISVLNADHTNSLVGIDKPITGYLESVSLDDQLVKSGRTTGVTTGTVQQVNASVEVGYGEAGSFQIEDCIITSDMSEGGDSGSPTAIEEADGLKAVGRLFAGSSSATVHHRFINELNILQNEFNQSISLLTSETDAVARVTLTIERETTNEGTIRVTVQDTEGNPVQDATVTISGAASNSANTDSNGLAEFANVPIGTYTIKADKEGFSSSSTTINSDDF